MKKTAIILLTAMLCGIIGTGCSDQTKTTSAKKDSVSLSKSSDENEAPDNGDTPGDEEYDDESNDESGKDDDGDDKAKDKDKSKDKDSDDNDGESSRDKDDVIPEEDNESKGRGDQTGDDSIDDGSNSTYSIDSGDLTDIAVELHNKCCEYKWKYLMRCPYPVDENDTINNNDYIKVEVDSLATLKSEYCQVFAGDGSELDEKYIEQDGKVYWRDGGRGSDIFYTGTDLISVSSDDNKAVFTAVSHYADPDTREPMDSRSYDFVMINDNGTWKASEFTLPN